MDVKWVKIRLASLRVATYMRTVKYVIEPLKNRPCLRKKLLFNFLGADFVRPKSSHRRQKQPVKQNINITKELDIGKHLRVSFFVVAIKINYFTTSGCYAICCTVKIGQINGLRGGQNVWKYFSLFLENVFHLGLTKLFLLFEFPSKLWNDCGSFGYQ